MKIYAWKHLVIIAGVCALGTAGARPKPGTAPTQKAGLPSAAILARRAVQAYDHLHYPLSATLTLESYLGGLGSKHNVKRSVEYVRANDQSHWFREDPGYVARYVSGSTLVMYSAKTKTYRSPDTNKVELREVFGVMTRAVDQLRWLLSDAKMKRVLSSATVTKSTIGKAAVYVIHLKQGIARYDTIAIDMKDSTIRRVSASFLGAPGAVWTVWMNRELKSFPSSTFIRTFSGPQGRVMPSTTEPPTPPGPPMK